MRILSVLVRDTPGDQFSALVVFGVFHGAPGKPSTEGEVVPSAGEPGPWVGLVVAHWWAHRRREVATSAITGWVSRTRGAPRPWSSQQPSPVSSITSCTDQVLSPARWPAACSRHRPPGAGSSCSGTSTTVPPAFAPRLAAALGAVQWPRPPPCAAPATPPSRSCSSDLPGVMCRDLTAVAAPSRVRAIAVFGGADAVPCSSDR